MRAMICDKCKRVYGEAEILTPTYDVRAADFDEKGRVRGERHVDLCPMCYDKLVTFLTAPVVKNL